MPKQLLLDEDGRAALLRGIDVIAHAVKVTLGPKGRNGAIARKFGSPTVTKDGVAVAVQNDCSGLRPSRGSRAQYARLRHAASSPALMHTGA